MTKTAEDRRIVLCPRAQRVLEQQLQLREKMRREGHINHDFLFVEPDGEPIRHLREVYSRWRRSLRSLAIRYRKPYAARHSSVSWNLMIGLNPLWVCKQHGHSIVTMLRVYAAWVEGVRPPEVAAIRHALKATATAERIARHSAGAPFLTAAEFGSEPANGGNEPGSKNVEMSVASRRSAEAEFGSRIANRNQLIRCKSLKRKKNFWRRG